MRTPVCCKIGCSQKAEYEIWHGHRPKPDDYTHACADHIGDLLSNEPRHEIVRLSSETESTEGDAP